MADKQKELTNLYIDLNRCEQNEDFAKALKICNKILNSYGDDSVAYHCKVVCLVQLSRFDDALAAIKKSKYQCDLSYEKAYCEYRLNKVKEARNTLKSCADQTTRVQELMAQILYRLEDYTECLVVYRSLIKNSEDNYEDERVTNLSAVMAALQTKDHEQNVDNSGLNEDSYELCYNGACFLIAQGHMKEGLEKLKQAEKMCVEFFSDDPDTTEDEVEAELGIIRVQQGYVLQKLNRSGEAMKLYNHVLKNKPTDISLSAVASNNVITLNKDQNVFDSKKKIKLATGNALKTKLTSAQNEKIAYNQCLLYMYSNQSETCLDTAAHLHRRYPHSSMPAMIQAAQYCRDKQISKAIDTLKSQLNEDSSLDMHLTLAQLYLTEKKFIEATQILNNMGDYSYRPGVVSSLVTLYMSLEDYSSAAEVLDAAVVHYTKHQGNTEECAVLTKYCAQFHLKHGDPKQAAKLLEQARKLDPGDLKVLAQLITAYSKFDPSKAQQVSKQLPSPEELSADVDVKALESSAALLGAKYIRKVKQVEASPGMSSPSKDAELEKIKKKKKKKGKLPKNLDPDATIDAERWLPKRERSYYKSKKRKNKNRDNYAVGKGSQGATSSAQFDKSSPAYSSPITSSPQDARPKDGPRAQKPSGRRGGRKGRRT